jgi:hypothetical protein
LHGTSWRCGEAHSAQCRGVAARAIRPALLDPFSTSLPPRLLERFRVAARQLGLGDREVAAEAIERLLDEEGF